MELFDKKFVYFMWDDKLEGQKGFVANYINDLKLAVNQGYWTKYGPLHKGSDAYPFRTIVDERWCLCYCDPNYFVKRAYYMEGKTIQSFSDNKNKWFDVVGEPSWLDGMEYRVKPDCPCEDGIDSKACVGCEHSEDGKKEYRPYINSAEMIVDFIDRFNVNCPSHCEPLIWVKGKYTHSRFLVFAFYETFIKFNDDEPLMFKELFTDYTYLDGSPCGMEVKE